MKCIILLLFLIAFSSQDQVDTSKMIIIYFTRTGNTELFANYIKEKMNIETIFKIEPETPYPENYDQTLAIARNEQSNKLRPEIKNPLTDVSKYDTILLGTPLWYSHIPNIVITQLEKLDLNGKTIYSFNTHGSSGLGSTVTDIKQNAKGATVKDDGFPLAGTYVRNNKENAMNDISSWVEKNFGNINPSPDQAGTDKSTTDNKNNNEEEKDNDDDTVKLNSEFTKINYFLFLIILSLL